MESVTKQEISAFRLRIGFLFIFLWWAPFWMLAPYLAKITGISTSVATLLIMLIQTAIGFVGIMIVGKQASQIIKHSSFKNAIKTIFYVLLHGKLKEQL